MKLPRLLLLLLILTTFSCSDDDNGSSNQNLPEQGNIALALSNGAGFVVENIDADITVLYEDSNTTAITITGTAGSSGNILIRIVDNQQSFQAITPDAFFTIGDESLSFFATLEYTSDNFNLDARAGTLDIINYEEFPDENFARIRATFSATGSGFNTITSTISDLILSCSGC